MIRGGFLSQEHRVALIALALLDSGWSCRDVADALSLDDDTIRNWRKLFENRSVEGEGQLRHGRERELFERRARRRLEGLGHGNLAALDALGRRLDRSGIRPRLRKPLGPDRAVASPGLQSTAKIFLQRGRCLHTGALCASHLAR
jgi:transposase-like protein